MFFCLVVFIACSNDTVAIKIVQDGYLDDYPQMPLGKDFEKYLYDPDWEETHSDDRFAIVKVSGQANTEKDIFLKVEFKVDKKTS